MSVSELVYRDKLEELDTLLKDYRQDEIDDAVYQMFHGAQTPLCNHWPSAQRFYASYYLLNKLAKNLHAKDFVYALLKGEIPTGVDLTPQERLLLTCRDKMQIEARFMYDFLISMADYYDYEITLLEHGYQIPKSA